MCWIVFTEFLRIPFIENAIVFCYLKEEIFCTSSSVGSLKKTETFQIYKVKVHSPSALWVAKVPHRETQGLT